MRRVEIDEISERAAYLDKMGVVPQGTFGRHVMGEIAGQRNGGQQLRQPQPPIRTCEITSHG